jgi:hypothetical protein
MITASIAHSWKLEQDKKEIFKRRMVWQALLEQRHRIGLSMYLKSRRMINASIAHSLAIAARQRGIFKAMDGVSTNL